ncbi:DUF2256 domain-containing protein [Ideonella livida]|uniref:DUF2256 domain-containing protein n=1 Tax=Ideonella livida TaxID=2707176 RepID=A0A7C9TKR7_9BURK|nr:DUF2256 domain-containing protein [Ideonella livida]NDY92698.1 DUF2256 domain-containing protein [Ideonella livida]
MSRANRSTAAPHFAGAKGLKARLPVKPCAHCGRPMAWRRAWARCWDEVRHCSEACRAQARRDHR